MGLEGLALACDDVPARLADLRFQTAQRQGLVAHIGQSQGNRALERWLAASSHPLAGSRTEEVSSAIQRQAEPAPDASTEKLKKHPFKLSSAKVTIVKRDKKKKLAELQEAPAHYADAILKKAGYKRPSDYFASFTSIDFLGRKLAKPIHIDLATHLQAVEKKLAAAYGGDAKDPKAAGDALGLSDEMIVGSREAPTSAKFSMHLFGLAVDLNYTGNPFVSSSANPVFRRAGLLVQGSRARFRSGMSYAELTELDRILTAYFSYIDSPDQLQARLDAATAAPWKGKSLQQATSRIQKDLDRVAALWQRSRPAQKGAIKKGGFLDLKEELVKGMELAWGGVYGDMMHFDMRNKGTGRRVHRAIGRYKAEKTREAREKYQQEQAEVKEKTGASPTIAPARDVIPRRRFEVIHGRDGCAVAGAQIRHAEGASAPPGSLRGRLAWRDGVGVAGQRSPLAIQRQAARGRPKTAYGGTVFLPGAEHVGHVYSLEGDRIVERRGKEKTPVATIDEKGSYYLLGPDGSPAATPSGRLADLTGRVTRRAGRRTRVLARTTASGEFRFPDRGGKERLLTIADGAIYLGAGKAKQLVGHVDAEGNYQFTLDGDVHQGSLADLPAGKVKARLARVEGRKVVEGLQIDQEQVNEGVVYFDDAKYTVRKGRLFREGEKTPAGELTVVKKGAGRRARIDSILYRYTDAKGKEQSGDLLSGGFAHKAHPLGKATAGPGEGSALQVGGRGRWRAFAGARWEQLAQVGRGFKLHGGGRLENRLRQLKKAGKLSITEDEIGALQAAANVESSGFTQCINTYDSDVLSFGFKQYTMAGKLQNLIARVPSAFARYGIQLGGELTIKKGKKVKGIVGITTAQELRGAYWAAKFYQAGLDDEIIVAQVAKAKEDLKTIMPQVRRLPALTTTHARDILFELHNNRPAYVKPVLNRTLARAGAKTTEEEFIKILQEEMESEYVKYRAKHGNGKTDEQARAKARRIVTKTRPR